MSPKIIGKSYYTSAGQKVELLAVTAEGKFVVCEVIEVDSYDGPYFSQGRTLFEDVLHEEAPRAIFDQRIKDLEEQQSKLEAKNGELRAGIIQAERDVRDRFAKLKKYAGLERIEDLIDGRITHFVKKSYSDVEIIAFAQLEQKDDRGRPEGIKLISLFGNSKGDLSWRVNDYRDGSGSSWVEIIPCASEEEAKTKRIAVISDTLKDYSVAKVNAWQVTCAVNLAIKYGIEYPVDLAAIHRTYTEEARAKNLAEAQKRLAEAQAQVAKFSAVSA